MHISWMRHCSRTSLKKSVRHEISLARAYGDKLSYTVAGALISSLTNGKPTWITEALSTCIFILLPLYFRPPNSLII
ncbi:hypothetical protein Pelo_16870 [Pelomyxa schiedti]|nr:hypothetical protein Pelo_16870 [Pelomyxa schiedti]